MHVDVNSSNKGKKLLVSREIDIKTGSCAKFSARKIAKISPCAKINTREINIFSVREKINTRGIFHHYGNKGFCFVFKLHHFDYFIQK